MFELTELNQLLQGFSDPLILTVIIVAFIAYKLTILVVLFASFKVITTKIYDFFRKPRDIAFGGRSISPEVEQLLLEQLSRIAQNPWTITLSDIEHLRKLIDNEKNTSNNL
jgi:hypothetical protein